MHFLRKITSFLNIQNNLSGNIKSKKNNQKLFLSKTDDNLIFPYLDTKTIEQNPNTDEYNLERIYSIKNLLNHEIHPSNGHKNLRQYYEKNKLIPWIGIVSDIMPPKPSHRFPILLIDKVAYDDPTNPYLLDNHLWIAIDRIKFIDKNSNEQTIAIGDAIRGIGKITTYHGNNGEIKYGFESVIIKGAGILVGNKAISRHQNTDLSSKLITNYNRHDNWILKLSNKPQNGFHYHNLTAKEILNSDQCIDYLFQENKGFHYYVRTAIYHKKQKRAISSTKSNKNVIIPTGPLTTYTAKIRKITYQIEGKNIDGKNNYQIFMVISDIHDELNKKIAEKSYFKYEGEILKLGQLFTGDKIKFSTRSILPNTYSTRGTIMKCQQIKSNHPFFPLPNDFETLLGCIMTNMRDYTSNHFIFREKYRFWATKHNLVIHQSLKKNSKNLISEKEIKELLQINSLEFEQLQLRANVVPSEKINNINYYSTNSINKIRKELKLEEMLQNLKKDKLTTKSTIPISITNDFSTYTTICSKNDQELYTDLYPNLSSLEIANNIRYINQITGTYYVQALDEDKRNRILKTSNIKKVRAANDVWKYIDE